MHKKRAKQRKPQIQLARLDTLKAPPHLSYNPDIDPPDEEYTQIVTQKYVRTMQKALTKKRIRRARKNFCHFIRSFDQFGQPIPLNYRGADTYKTLPGSFLSFIAIVLLCVGLMKGVNNLIYNMEWTQNTQVEILGRPELTKELQFSDYPNFKAGVELKLREGIELESREEYLEYAGLVAEVYSINEVSYVVNSSGFFQMADKPETAVFGFNENSLEMEYLGYRHKRKSPDEMVNSQKYLEFSIDLNGTSVAGSESTTLDVQNKYVSFFHILDYNAFHKKVIDECRANDTCGSVLKSDSEVFNTLSEVYYCNDAKNASQKEAYFNYLQQAIKDDGQKYSLHFQYYLQFETVKFSSPLGVSRCNELLLQQMAGNEACDYDDHDIELGSKCLFKWHNANLTSRLSDAHSRLVFKPVVYDEITYFKDGVNKYPFQERKSKFSAPITKGYPKDSSLRVENYAVTLQRHQVCMDDNIWAEFMMFDDTIYKKCDYETDFEILQKTETTISYMDFFPVEINLMLTLTMDNQMSKTTVRSYKFYDMLADNGGFFEALISLFAVLGSPISRLFFQYSIAKDSYYTRDKKKVLQKRYKTADNLREKIFRADDRFDYQKIKEFFPKIRFTAAFYAVSACCKCLICKCCKGLKQQKRILKKANDRFEDELDVIQLLKKVRLSTDIWTQLLSRSQKKALKYSRGNVIVQKDKKKNPLLRRVKTLFEKLEHPSTTSDSISFSISNTSSESSFFQQENKALLHPNVIEAHTFFQVPIVNTLPLPKKMPNGLRFPQFIQEEFFSDPSPSPMGIPVDKYHNDALSDRPRLRKRNLGSHSPSEAVTERQDYNGGDFSNIQHVPASFQPPIQQDYPRRKKKPLLDDILDRDDSEPVDRGSLQPGAEVPLQIGYSLPEKKRSNPRFDSPQLDQTEQQMITPSDSRRGPGPIQKEQNYTATDLGTKRRKKKRKRVAVHDDALTGDSAGLN